MSSKYTDYIDYRKLIRKGSLTMQDKKVNKTHTYTFSQINQDFERSEYYLNI